MTDQANFPGFDDGKAPDALRTIGEVAAALNIRQHVLRYWEDQFPMLRPVKRSGGRRYYRPDDVRLVATIDRLVHGEGYTLRGARQVIESGEGKTATRSAIGSATRSEGTGPDAIMPARDATVAPHTVGRPIVAELAAIRDSLARALAEA